MELASTDLLYSQPRHPYTQGLLAAVPVPDPDLQPQRLGGALGGELPSPMAPPSGCVFRTRCAHAVAACAAAAPRLQSVETGHEVACDRWREISASGAVA
jgi:oligopeptide/dipeptide ABC transporter ATP-binding protein